MSEKDFETKDNQAPEAEETVPEDTSIQEYRAEGTAEGVDYNAFFREAHPPRKGFNFSKLKYGSMAVVLTVVFIVVVVGVNILVNLAAQRFTLRLDFSSEQLFTLDPETVDLLEGLNKDVEIIVLGEESAYRAQSSTTGTSPYKYLVETTDNYAKTSDRVKLAYVNHIYNPQYFTSRGIALDDGTGNDPLLVVYSPDTGRYRLIKTSVVNELQYMALESRMTAAVNYVTRDNLQSIALVTGHGEAVDSMAYYEMLMEDNGFDVSYLTLQEVDAIPEEIDILVINNPQRQYSDGDISKIDTFLSNGERLGKHLMVFGDLTMKTNPKLEDYLNLVWGVSFGKENIFDNKRNIYTLSTYAPLLRANYTQEYLVGDLLPYSMYVELGKARPVNMTFAGESKDDTFLYTVLGTHDSSFGRVTLSTGISTTELNTLEKTETDVAGPFDLGIMSRRVRYEGMTEYNSTVVVFGTSSLVEDYFVSNIDGQNESTADFLLKTTRFLVNTTESVDTEILTKKLITSTLNFQTNAQVIVAFLGLVFGVPAILALIGILVWRRRRYL